METQVKKSNTDTAIQVVSGVLGAIHFTFQTLADLTAHAEGKAVESISKGAITYQETVNNRKQSTELKQKQALLKLQQIKDKAKAKSQANVQPQQS